ncbi:hypothetical protein ACMD2_10512 [Ananas comosus]|uniref:Uncharacterized protein n=1 Tax=Ananas comosus TaxID=4615 RepID=A0A199UT24_ANACO|nr:hypothetical protein ACMD2_10512 [Ananas comosus]
MNFWLHNNGNRFYGKHCWFVNRGLHKSHRRLIWSAIGLSFWQVLQLSLRCDMGSDMLHRELLCRKSCEDGRRIVLLFIYLLYKIGICGCISKGMCKMLWSCIVSCFSSCEYLSMLAWFKLKNLKQSREERKRYLEDYYDTSSDDDLEERISYSRVPRSTELRRTLSKRSRDRRRIYLDRSLRPRSHRIRVGISRRSIYMNENDQGLKHHHGHVSSALHNIKVTHTSRFVQKANVKRIHHRRY